MVSENAKKMLFAMIQCLVYTVLYQKVVLIDIRKCTNNVISTRGNLTMETVSEIDCFPRNLKIPTKRQRDAPVRNENLFKKQCRKFTSIRIQPVYSPSVSATSEIVSPVVFREEANIEYEIKRIAHTRSICRVPLKSAEAIILKGEFILGRQLSPNDIEEHPNDND